MQPASRSVSVERRDSYRANDSYDRPKDNGGYPDDRYNKSRSRSIRRSQDRSRSPQLDKQSTGNVLYVGNLNRRIGEEEFRDLFGRFGKIERVQLIKDPSTKECRGFGFVDYTNPEDAERAVQDLDQKEYDGRKLRVEKSKRGMGYERTPGRYLGYSRSNHYGGRDFSPSRRQRSPRRDRRDFRDYRERSPRGGRRFSRSRSGERDRERGGYRRDYRDDRERRYGGEPPRYRERSYSRDRYNGYRPRDRSSPRDRR